MAWGATGSLLRCGGRADELRPSLVDELAQPLTAAKGAKLVALLGRNSSSYQDIKWVFCGLAARALSGSAVGGLIGHPNFPSIQCRWSCQTPFARISLAHLLPSDPQ